MAVIEDEDADVVVVVANDDPTVTLRIMMADTLTRLRQFELQARHLSLRGRRPVFALYY